ncbi:nucleoside-diphosphate kinase [Candidatus Amesbacteria bacterium]|nr:nucleoside-diphosphate kinase [Candidatus Amesbacteria bacterium]
MNFIQQTVVLIKPDGLQRGLVGAIINRFEIKGLKLVGLKMVNFTDEIVNEWYSHHKDKSFFADIKKFMTWTPIVAMVWEGVECINAVRKIVGITKARAAEAGSIRGDFGMSGSQNLIHASDSIESAEKERKMIFSADEIFVYHSGMDSLIYSKEDLDSQDSL